MPAPQASGDCPYLSATDVAELNGERVSVVQLDPTQHPPACFFDRADGGQLLSVWVYRAPSVALANAAVNRAAVVVTTNQEQSVRARRATTQVIGALGL